MLESYRVIVQALFNLTYIQALFTIISEMNKNEQEIWSTIPMNTSENVSFHLDSFKPIKSEMSIKEFDEIYSSYIN